MGDESPRKIPQYTASNRRNKKRIYNGTSKQTIAANGSDGHIKSEKNQVTLLAARNSKLAPH